MKARDAAIDAAVISAGGALNPASAVESAAADTDGEIPGIIARDQT